MLIEPNYIGTGLGIIHARTKLAKAVLSVAKQSGAGSPEDTAKRALRVMLSNGEHALPFDQRCGSKIEPIKKQKVEGIV